MATRSAIHTAAVDAGPAPLATHTTVLSGSAVDAASNAVPTVAQVAPQVALDAAAFEPSQSISAYANAAAVAASTAVLVPSSVASASSVTAATSSARTRAIPSPAPVQLAVPTMTASSSSPPPSASTSSLPVTPAPQPLPSRSRVSVGRPSSKFGTVNYSLDEMRRLNEKVRAVMPIATEDWLHVAYQFNYMRPESIPYREVESLKRKFKKMYCFRASAGGKLPDYAQEAKELRRQINQRSERAQIQVDTTQSDSQSEIDAQDIASAHSGGTGDNEMPGSETVEPATTTDVLGTTTTTTTNATMDVEIDASGTDDAREIAQRLRLMEDEYHRMIASKRGSGSSTSTAADGLGSIYTDPSMSSAPLGIPGIVGAMGGSAAPLSAADTSTSGIINMLKHSIERKRRTIEEQMLSESERVRKERKKRKMEQVLYNIHREQTGGAVSEIPVGGPAASPGGSAIGVGAHQNSLLSATTANSLPGTAPPPSTGNYEASSLGVLEIALQFMIAQQQDTERRIQKEEERRRIEAQERERRRRMKDAQRRKDKHELMLVMAALLQENFPEELRQYLDPATTLSDVDSATSTSNCATANPGKPSELGGSSDDHRSLDDAVL